VTNLLCKRKLLLAKSKEVKIGWSNFQEETSLAESSENMAQKEQI
jgi:hypothetical protein